MTVATLQKEVTGLRQEIGWLRQDIAALAVLVNRLSAPVLVATGTPDFIATFPTLGPFRTDPGDGISNDGIWWVERTQPDRVMVVPGGRDGPYALRLHTEPGDSAVSGSGAHERADVALRGQYDMFDGEWWFAHSILFPDDYAIPPPGHWNVVFNFHDTSANVQANFQLFSGSNGLTFRGFGGQPINDASLYTFGAELGPIVRNTWYDFVYHVKWSATDGFFDAWMNEERKLSHVGPTLYAGYGVYLKLANYHSAFGKPSSVLHDRIVRGKTWQSVSLTPLEGVT